MDTEQPITSKSVYSFRQDMRRYHADGNAIGCLNPVNRNEWTVRFTEPQPSGLPWTEFHTPRILSEMRFAAGSVKDADAFAKDWLEGQMVRHAFGDEIADVVDDFLTFATAAE